MIPRRDGRSSPPPSADGTADDGDALPVPNAAGPALLRVRPSDAPLVPESVASGVRRLHELGGRAGHRSVLDRLRRRSPPPTVEAWLTSSGGDTEALTYAFGVDDAALRPPLTRVFRGLFPDSYEFEPIARPDTRSAGTPASKRISEAADAGGSECLAAVEFHGRATRRSDWQTGLAPFAGYLRDPDARMPLAAVAETMAASTVPMAYQVLFRPLPDWTQRAADRRVAIEAGQDTLAGQLTNVLFGLPDGPEGVLTADDETRLDALEARDAQRSFALNARLVAIDPDGEGARAERAVRELASTFAAVSGTSHTVEGVVSTGRAASPVWSAICERRFARPRYDRPTSRLPFTANTSPGIVADAAEIGSFLLLGGQALTAAGARSVSPTPTERTALPRPPVEQLVDYRDPGLTIGHPLTQDGSIDPEPIAVPPELQPLHAAWFGKTGSGKSTSLITAILDNHEATDGADILVDPKGDGMGLDYLRAHFARYGTLDDVIYFDCAEVLPAFSFFDIRADLAAGVPRTTAVEDRVDHYVEVLMQVMGRDRFEQAVRSPDVIRYLVKALFDPVNGQDAFGHLDLHDAVRVLHELQAAPAVSDTDLEISLAGVVANRARTFDEIMAGVANRIEKIPVDERLARIFNHVPRDPEDPHFDLASYLDEDVVIVFDTGGLRSEAQRVLALVVLSNLWSALRRRTQREPDGDRPLVNVYLEEAASVAVSDLLAELLAHARGFACSMTLSMQFPAQLRGADQDAYEEVLNNVSTVVTGNVPSDPRLAARLATDDMDADAVGNRLRALRRGQWMARLPAGFDAPEPRPFLVGSGAPPPGDPDGPRPLAADERQAFEAEHEALDERVLAEVGLSLAKPGAVEGALEEVDPDPPENRVDSALPYTKRLPSCMTYEPATHALWCLYCDSRYDADLTGMKRAIACCWSMEKVDRDDIPITTLNLKLSPEERLVSDRTDRQLMFVQAVYNAQQLRYDPLEYDLLYDSMLRLQEYVGIDSEAVQDLVNAGLLRHDTDHPHRLFSVTPEGRKEIGEHYREGVDYGHGVGDLDESSAHVFAVEVGRRYLEAEFVANPESSVVEVVPYHDIDEGRRLDVAGLDADGAIVVAVEAERINHDARRAIPDDFDKMAECDVEEAIWIVMRQADGHAIVQALNEPPDGEPRIEKTYAPTTPPQQFSIETPGLTAVYPAEWLRVRMDRS